MYVMKASYGNLIRYFEEVLFVVGKEMQKKIIFCFLVVLTDSIFPHFLFRTF